MIDRSLVLLTVPELAARVGVSRSHLSRRARAGAIATIRPGDGRYYVALDADVS